MSQTILISRSWDCNKNIIVTFFDICWLFSRFNHICQNSSVVVSIISQHNLHKVHIFQAEGLLNNGPGYSSLLGKISEFR